MASYFAHPEIKINISKSRFLFIKWANFGLVVSSATGEPTSLPQISKWYVFADYIGEIQAGHLTVAIDYKLNSSTDYKSTPVTTILTEDKISTSSIDLSTECFSNPKFVATFESVQLVDKVFHAMLSITCEAVNVPNAVREIGEGIAEIIEGSKKDEKKSPSQLQASVKGKTITESVRNSQVQKSIKDEGKKLSVQASLHESNKLIL